MKNSKRGPQSDMIQYLKEYSNQIIISLLGLNILLFLVIIIQSAKNKNLKKKFLNLTNNQDFKSLEQAIKITNEKIDYFEEVLKALQKNYHVLNENSKLNIKKLGIIRYDAFENVGSKLSFALALLDEYDNGVVINSIYSREGSNIYAKPIENGLSKYPLSAEEMQAIDLAKKDYFLKEVKE